MTTVYLKGPDLVEVTFSSKVELLTLTGFAISTKNITDFTVVDNKILFSIDVPVVSGDPNTTFTYSGNGNLVSLPSYTSIGSINQPVINNVELEYMNTLDGQIEAGQAYYHRYNDVIFPVSWLTSLDGASIVSLDSEPILTDSSPNSWLEDFGGADFELLGGDSLVVDPYT